MNSMLCVAGLCFVHILAFEISAEKTFSVGHLCFQHRTIRTSLRSTGDGFGAPGEKEGHRDCISKGETS